MRTVFEGILYKNKNKIKVFTPFLKKNVKHFHSIVYIALLFLSLFYYKYILS